MAWLIVVPLWSILAWLLWLWLRLLSAWPGDHIEPLTKWSGLANALWIAGFFMMPGLCDQVENPETRTYAIFFLQIIFGKFFLEAVSPGLPVDQGSQCHLKGLLITPIANVFAVCVIVPLLAHASGWLPGARSENINFALNAMADFLPPWTHIKVGETSNFNVQAVMVSFVIVASRILVCPGWSLLRRGLVLVGSMFLLTKVMKYAGSVYGDVFSFAWAKLSEEYSPSSLALVGIAWCTPFVVHHVKNATRIRRTS